MANAKEEAAGTVQDDSTEEEEVEDSTEENPEDTNEEPSTKSGESTEKYFDLTKLPPELQAVGKKMQATHTKKMQTLAMHVRKSSAFDEILEHPDFAKFLADVESGAGYGASVKGKTQVKEDAEESDDDEPKSGGKIDMDKLVKSLAPLIERVVQQRIAPLIKDRANSQWDKAREQFDDFDDFLPEITALIKEFPTMTLPRAYKLAKEEADEDTPGNRREETKRTLAKAKKAKTEGAGGAKSPVTNLTSKTAKTLKEALSAALDEQGFKD